MIVSGSDPRKYSLAWRDLLLSPFVLASDLFLLFGSKIILDIESLPDLLGRLPLDHIGNSFTSDIKKGFDIQVVGSLEQAH